MSGSYVDDSGRAESFNQQAAHDTGLYDPNVHDNQIVALYESEEKARVARDKLIAAGVPAGALKVMERDADRMAGGVDYESGNQGIWGAIKSLFMPDEDAHAYNHAIGRGHAMVVVTPTRDMDRHHVIEVLESTDPMDFDAKLEEWRQAGYQAMEASGSSSGTSGASNATVERAQATPANYAVNQTTVTDHIPADARRPADMPAGVAGTPAGTAGTSTGSGTAAGAAGAVAGGLAAAGRGVANAAERAVDAVSDAVTGRDDATRHTATTSGTGATTNATAGTTIPTTQAGRSTEDASRPVAAGADDTIKVVQEQLRVGKREVARGAVRVRSYVVQRPVEEEVRLHEERVQIERRPVDRPIAEADAAFRDRTVEVQARAEEAVVGKEARVVEEIGVRKEANERVETVRDTVRHTEVEIENTGGQTPSTTGTSGSGTMGTGGNTSTATTGATSSGTNAPRK